MRLKTLRTPSSDELAGIDLRRFTPGHKYDVGNRLGAVMLAEGWAEPVPNDDPALLIPFSDTDAYMSRVMDRNSSPNLVRETYPPYTDETAIAAEEPFINSDEIASHLGGISVKMVRTLCIARKNPLPHVRIGGKRQILSKRSWLNDWLEQQRPQVLATKETGGRKRLQDVRV
jgi:hypothetical protein